MLKKQVKKILVSSVQSIEKPAAKITSAISITNVCCLLLPFSPLNLASQCSLSLKKINTNKP